MMAYLLQLTLVWGVLYGCYSLFLRKLTFFGANRLYLVFSLLAGLWLPTLDFDLAYWLPAAVGNGTPAYLPPLLVDWQQFDRIPEVGVVTVFATGSSAASGILSNWHWLYYVYLLGFIFSLIRLVFGLWQIQRLYLEGKKYYRPSHIRIDHPAVTSPFSYFRWIFWSPELDPTTIDGQRILRHEIAHTRQGHSWDMVLLELLQIIGWFHPLLFLYRRSLQQLHEYQADAAVLRETAVRSYGVMLLRQAQRTGQPAFLAHPFSTSQLKNRILMMTRTRSRYQALWRFALPLPILIFLLIAFQNPGISQVENAPTRTESADKIYQEVDEMPLFPGTLTQDDSRQALFKYLLEELKYPQMAREKKIEGVNVIQFVIMQDGNIGKVEALSDIGGDTAEEAIRVVKGIPNGWTPGKVNGQPVPTMLQLPVHFRLPGEKMSKTAPKEPGQTDVRPNLGRDDTDAQKPSVEETFLVVEEMPLFPGAKNKEESDQALIAFLGKKINYPEAAREKGIQGTNVVEFVVDKDGSVRDVKLLRDIGAGTGEESIRVVESLPDGWTPGKQRNLQVNVQLRIPIAFKLPEKEGGPATIKLNDSDGRSQGEDLGNDQKESFNEVFLVVEEMPLFPGTQTVEESNQAFMNYIGQQINYPKVAAENGVEGMIVVEFIVRKNGQVDDVKLLRDIGAGTGEEGMRVVRSMPDWQPGRQGGQLVDVALRVPIRFSLPVDTEAYSMIRIDTENTNNSLAQNAFSIAPNPASERVQILFREPLSKDDVLRIYNAEGKLIPMPMPGNWEGATEKAVTFESAGLYYIQLVKNNKSLTKKVIVQ